MVMLKEWFEDKSPGKIVDTFHIGVAKLPSRETSFPLGGVGLID